MGNEKYRYYMLQLYIEIFFHLFSTGRIGRRRQYWLESVLIQFPELIVVPGKQLLI